MPKKRPENEIIINNIDGEVVSHLRQKISTAIKKYGKPQEFGIEVVGIKFETIIKRKATEVTWFAFELAENSTLIDVGQQVKGENVRLLLSDHDSPMFVYEDRSPLGNGLGGSSPTMGDLNFYSRLSDEAIGHLNMHREPNPPSYSEKIIGIIEIIKQQMKV